jgi:hypothetical protein
MTATAGSERIVTREDIEAKLREIQGVTDTTTEVAQEAAKPLLIVIVVAVVIGAFLLGKRRGRKRSTVVEVRRI